MGMTMTQKILAAHAGLDSVEAGQLIEADLDLVLGNDVTTPVAIHEMDKFNKKEVFDKNKIALVMDHFTPNKDIKSAEHCKCVREFSAENQIKNFFDVGSMGIEHALLPEQGLIVAGETCIGADSHTCTYGALGAFSTGVGSTDMAAGMVTGKAWFKVPSAIKFNIVGEKEAGTIEQINVTPVGKFTFILAKLLPYWLIGFVVLTICFILAWVLYGITPVGHFLIIYFFAVLFVLSMSGLGLVISNHSATMQQSMFVMWFCMLVLILMSGLFTPISSMPEWAQVITVFNPLKYLMQVMRMVYLKGSGMADLLPQLGALLAFALVLNIWAVKSFKKVEG